MGETHRVQEGSVQPQDVSAKVRHELQARWRRRGIDFRQSHFFNGADYWALSRRFGDGSTVTVTVTNLYEEQFLAAALEIGAGNGTTDNGTTGNGRRYASWPYEGANAETAIDDCLGTLEAWLLGHPASLERVAPLGS